MKQVLQIEKNNLFSNIFGRIHHTYDRLGNRLNRTDLVAGQSFNEIYQYDNQSQLIDLDRTNNHEHFHYDSTGNWLACSHNDTVQTRTNNTANELLTIDNSTTSITTDPSGNLTRIPNPFVATSASSSLPAVSSFFHSPRRFAAPRKTVSAEPKSLNLTYDAWNRLVRVTSTNGTPIARYTYDGLNRRILKTTPSETRRYYYNHKWQCLLETADDQPSIHYTWGLRYIDDLVCRHVGLDKIYSLADPNWNVVALTDSTATPLERYTYTAFGTCQIHTPTFTPRPTTSYHWTRTFTSQLLDPETGLMLYRNRFYHPTLGRFITKDPIGYAGMDANLYRYVRNQILTQVDIYGLLSTREMHSSCKAMLQNALDLLKEHETYKTAKKCTRGRLRIICGKCSLSKDLQGFTSSAYPYPICIDIKTVCDKDISRNPALFTGLVLHELYHVVQYCNNIPSRFPRSTCEPAAYQVQAEYLFPENHGDTECQKEWQAWFVENNYPISCGKKSPQLPYPQYRPAIRYQSILYNNGNGTFIYTSAPPVTSQGFPIWIIDS